MLSGSVFKRGCRTAKSMPKSTEKNEIYCQATESFARFSRFSVSFIASAANDRNKHMYVTWCFLRSSLSPFVGDIPLPGFFCFLISLIFLYLFPSPFSKFEFKCISSYKSAETHPTDFPNFSIQSICSRLQIHSLSALQISRFAHLLRLSLNFSSSLFVIRVNLLHP